MPTYEYECGSCHHRFERKQRFDEEPVAMCPKCKGKARRVIHSVPVIFKGSGFYTTDSRKGMPEPDKGEKELPGEGKKKGKK
jgi:putative FmdB family regulatory protein